MWRLATIGALVVVLGVGCASGTKSGGTVKHPIRIVMEASDGPDTDPNSSYFVSQVQKRSGGRIQIVLGNDYPNSDISNEPRLVRALRSGKVQMAYIPARAWEEGSRVTAFRALQAPLLVTSYPVLRRITTGPIGRSMLASLNSIGVVGLGLVPQRLRRLLGRRPLDSAKTLHGARIRPITSPTGELALRALGAVPVTIVGARGAGPALATRRIDGVESETISIENNNYMNYAPYLTTNIALFAKATTIAIGRSVFERLSATDRGILRAAAAATVAHADPAAAERTDMETLCRQRIKLVTAAPADLASLDRLAASVYPQLEQDGTTRREIRAIEQLKQKAPDAVSDIPGCPGSRASHPRSNGVGPVGTYTVTVSQAEIAKASGGQPNENWGSFQLSFHNRRFRLSDRRAAGELVPGRGNRSYSNGSSAGTFAIQGDRITFTTTSARGDDPLGVAGYAPVICRWNIYRDQLIFRQLPAAAQARATARGLDAGGPPALYVRPWQPRPATKAAAAGPASKIVGAWVMSISRAEMKANGLTNWGFTRLVFGPKSFRISDRRPPGQPLVQGFAGGWTSGTYSIRGKRLTFFIGNGRGDTPLGRHGDSPIVVLASFYRNTLTLKQGKKNEGGASIWLKPWQRVS